MSSLEVVDLAQHLRRCIRSRGRLFAALSLSESVDRFLAPRVVTTMVVIGLIIAIFALP